LGGQNEDKRMICSITSINTWKRNGRGETFNRPFSPSFQ